MIRISKMADYAVVILAEMGRGEVRQMSSSSLSERVCIPEPTVSKILKILSKANLVCSMRGVNGGYSLNLPIEQISMRDVISAVDGPIAITSCTDGHTPDCSLAQSCSTRGRWDKVNTVIIDALKQVSLADMIGAGHKTAGNIREIEYGRN